MSSVSSPVLPLSSGSILFIFAFAIICFLALMLSVLCHPLLASITLAAWITHVLEGVVCFFVAMAYGISGVTSFIDASLVGAAGTAILFKKLNIARPGVVIPACLTAFAVIAFITHRIMV